MEGAVIEAQVSKGVLRPMFHCGPFEGGLAQPGGSPGEAQLLVLVHRLGGKYTGKKNQILIN